MTFEEMLEQAMAMLQRRGRMTYRALKRQFQLDEEALNDLKDELLYAHPQVSDDEGRGLVWTGGTLATPTLPSPSVGLQEREPLSYTPPHLAEKILTSRSALEGERKQVTVLFADLKGSMELLADRDPEEARQLLDPVLERMMAAVHRYEGTVNQVMGDGIMALFGAPIAHEDHAVRACYAALAMQAAIRRYSEDLRRTQGLEVQIRVGLNSGEVVVRTIGNDLHMDYTAVGQTTHLAARMEQLALPGTIRLATATVRLAEGFIEVQALGPVPVKGLAEPVEVYELVRAGPARSRLQAAVARGLTRFVGRDTELEQLRQALARAGAGQGQVVAGVGEAGVGKSRLLYEFTRSHHTHGWLLLASNSVSYGKATAYLPVLDLLKGYFQIEPQDDARRLREKVTGKLLTLDRTLEPMLPAFLALLEVPVEDPQWHAFDPSQRRRRTLEAIKHLLLRESQVQPLCLMFEDLHWIDAETQALLDSLVESLPTARLVLLVNYRPEYHHGWGSKTYYTQLRLDPLSPANADEVLQALLGDDPSLAPLNQLLIARTEGNPFFLEESVRTLVETGVLVGAPGAYRLAQAPPTIQVPATVQAVLAARIDRLPPEEKRLLQTAAVIGNEVPWPLLQAIAELSEAALHRGLAHLQAAEFLYETRLFPEHEYTFKHALTHEVAYSSVLQERRRALHARIVAALEALAGDRLAEQVERLAHHARRGEVWDKALVYCRQAGEKAFARGAFRETLTGYEQALKALGHMAETPDTGVWAIALRQSLADILNVLGEYPRSLTLLGEAEALARQLDDRLRLGQVLSVVALVHRMQGDLEGALATGRQALELAATLGDPALQAHVSFRLGMVYHGMGDFDRAAEVLRSNVEARARGTPGSVCDADWYARGIFSQAWLALALSALGEFAEGRHHGEEALRLATVVGQWDGPITAHACLGALYSAQGDLEAAVPVLERGLALCRASGHRGWFTSMAGTLGEAYARAGRLAEGLALLEEAGREALDIGALGVYTIHVRRLSAVNRLAGRLDEARQHACQALDLARQQQGRGDEALALFQLATVHAQASPPDVPRAEARYREALTRAEALRMRPLQAHCHRGLGMLYRKTDRREQARAELAAAITLYRAMEMTFWLPQAEAALAEVEGD
jgi:class 3 adenylate cyclase/tetratricopeptide (TPR) repeat protein